MAEPLDPFAPWSGPPVGSVVDDSGALLAAPGEWRWSQDALETAQVGPELAWELDSGVADLSSDADLLAAVVAFQRLAGWAQAGAARVAAALAERASMNPDWPAEAGEVTVTDVAAEEIAPALGWTRRQARRLVTDGRAWSGALAATGDALARGDLDLGRARVITDGLAGQPIPLAWAVQDAVLPEASTRTAAQLARDVAKAVMVVDPEASRLRTRAARDRRRVDRPRSLGDGLSGWWIVLPTADAARMDLVLDSVARAGRAAGDPRTVDQLRADVLVDLVLGRVGPGECVEAGGEPGPEGARVPRRVSSRTQINVTVPLDVLAAFSEGPGFVEGYGPVPAAVARELAEDATWRRILTDPATGAVLDVGRTRYRPPAHLAEHVRTRDRWCAAPGCAARAETCDLDHTREWERDHGPTADHNLGPLCPRHHQVKTHGGFRLRQVERGVFEWTTPLGRGYRVVPGRDEAYRRIDAAERRRVAGPGDPPF